jgi:RNA recognition motif-containing protein
LITQEPILDLIKHTEQPTNATMNSYLNTKSSIRHRSATSSNEDDDDNESTTTDARKKSHRVQSTSRETKNKNNKDDNGGDALTHRRQQRQQRRRRDQDNNDDEDNHVDKKMKNCTKLFIANIHPSVTNEKLEDLFDKYGKTVECEKIADKGYAFVVQLGLCVWGNGRQHER